MITSVLLSLKNLSLQKGSQNTCNEFYQCTPYASLKSTEVPNVWEIQREWAIRPYTLKNLPNATMKSIIVFRQLEIVSQAQQK
jgi:hypothetical protein